jgi:KipI family sensor histidine kinase inhibitor
VTDPPVVLMAGDQALVATWEARIDEAIHREVMRTATRIVGAGLSGVRDVVPAFHTLTVHIDPHAADVSTIRKLLETSAPGDESAETHEDVHVLSVRYGGNDGPDLAHVAHVSGCSVDEVVARHTAVIYRVYMIGFLPGFAYLATVDPRIQVSRRPEPRGRVAAGSVGLAGPQTGVYPLESPGGWQIIGRADAILFDAMRASPSILAPGRRVRFVAR